MIKSSLHFSYYCSSQAHTHIQTHTPANTLLWILEKGGDGSGKGIVSTLFKRVRKGAPVANKSTGLSAFPEESAGMKRRSLMERNNR